MLSLSPAFAKLNNPLLRRTVAKIATLRQVAQVGGISLADMVKRLRHQVGQDAEEIAETVAGSRPPWLQQNKITVSLDARPILEAGEHPLGQVLAALVDFPQQAVFELITPFTPAPLLDQVRKKGFEVYSDSVGADLVKSYFCKEEIAHHRLK